MKLIVVNGQPNAGKDTFVDMCIAYLGEDDFDSYGLKVSSVDKVKEAATLLGWHGEKDPEARKFLSDLKDVSTKLYNGPMMYMTSRIEEAKTQDYKAVFFFIREPKEIAKFMETYPEAITLLITRNGYSFNQSNHADLNVLDYPYNTMLSNDGTLEELQKHAEAFVDLHIRECHD